MKLPFKTKTIILCLLASLFIVALPLFSACDAATPPAEQPQNEPDTQPPPDLGAPTFYLETLPELAPYEAPREIIRRYSEEAFVDTLKPASDYGRLYPYEGKITGASPWEQKVSYGLVDALGRVVVDPVYWSAYYAGTDPEEEPAYLVLAYPVDNKDAATQHLMIDSYGVVMRGRYVFASVDGAWVSDIYYGDEASLSDDRIIIYDYNADAEYYWRDQSFRLYDLQGNLLARNDGYITGFSEGLSAVFHDGYDELTNTYQEYYDYIDKSGRIAIAGPFSQAESFVDGCAQVVIYDDWGQLLYGVIDTAGNFISEYSPIEYTTPVAGDYNIFYDQDLGLSGVKDRFGKITVSAKYTWIQGPHEQHATQAVAQIGEHSWWLIDFKSGEEKEITLPQKTITFARIVADNWCEINYENATESGGSLTGIALLKEDAEYFFEYPQNDILYCGYLQNDLFVVNYQNYQGNNAIYRSDIFDAATGNVIKSVDGYIYSYQLNDNMMIFNNSFRQKVINMDFEAVFGQDVLGYDPILDIRHVADDVYNVRTALCCGLLKENGEWLIRIYANSFD